MSDQPPLTGPTPVFALDLPHGRCVGVAIPPLVTDELAATLRPEERRFAEALAPLRQASFAAGRAALRLALRQAGLPDGLLLPGRRGAPTVPPGTLGSISHKRELAVALATTAAPDGRDQIGVDLEIDRHLRIDISRRVLTESELRRWTDLPSGQSRDRDLIVRFSLKESLYKAVNGFLDRYVSFQHVEIDSVDEHGSAVFSGLLLQENSLEVQGWVGSPATGLILTSVHARMAFQA